MQTIGRYQLVEKLGQGGMGTVYRAFDTLIERIVAIKVISSPVDLSPESRERFFREARAAGQLSHKNVITLYDLGEQEGQPYLAMEYLEGEDLQRRLQRPEKMSLSRKLDLAIEICEGLEYAHSRGVIHRDIKPANIFITERGTAKILDFGLARLMTSQLTNTNMLMGTLNYMAPEQVRGERADHRSDVFSLGVVLYELLSGKKAFEGDSFASTLYKILQEVPEPLWKIDATLPRELVAVVERALAKPRDERYQTMSEVRADLVAYRHVMHGETDIIAAPGSISQRPSSDSHRLSAPISSSDPTQPLSPPGGFVRPPSGARTGSGQILMPDAPSPWRPGIVIPFAAVLVLLVGGGIWMLQHRSAQRPSSPPVTSAPQTAPVDPAADTVRLAQQALQSQDYVAAERYADMVLKQTPQHAEARQIRSQAHDALVATALDKARSLMASGDFGEASRAAGEALALAPGNAEAKSIMEQASARMRGRGADEARTRTAEARSAAQAAGAPRLASSAFRSAARAEQDALRLYKAGRLAEAMTRFYEASGLYRSAESNARTEQAAAAAAAAAAPPVQAPSPAPAPPPSQSPSQTPSQTPAVEKPAAPPEPAPTTAPASQLPKPPASQLPKAPETPSAPPPAAPSTPLKTTSPPTQPTPELPSRSPTAEDRIGELLNRYKAALESRSLDDLRRVWPTLSGAPQDAIRNEFQHASHISVTLVDPQIQASSLAGVVTFLRRYDIVTVDGQRLHSEARTTMEVRRTPSGAWVIDSIRFTPVR